ncbi:hypothetical protein FQN54_001219 [Arachnomyces sp. PD_36]|nr:hypothetical protein FQN54_001219 [Arachnomyces sp. PD_36]
MNVSEQDINIDDISRPELRPPTTYPRGSAIPPRFLPPKMPKAKPTTAPLREALFACFRATTRLVQPELRRQLVLVGGAASIAHDSDLWSEDVDVAAPPNLLIEIWEKVTAGAPNFNLEPDGKISFDAPQGFRVKVDLIEIGDGTIIEQIHAAELFLEGSVASKSDLLKLRAVTVVERGSDGELADFRWLLSEVARAGQTLPELDDEDLGYVRKAAEACFGIPGRFLVIAILHGANLGTILPFLL